MRPCARHEVEAGVGGSRDDDVGGAGVSGVVPGTETLMGKVGRRRERMELPDEDASGCEWPPEAED